MKRLIGVFCLFLAVPVRATDQKDMVLENGIQMQGVVDSTMSLLSTLQSTAANLSAPGIINETDNPVDWTKLKGVPAGFSDGADDTGGGPGGGMSLPLPGGATNYIQNSSATQNGATLSVGSGTVKDLSASTFTIKGVSISSFSGIMFLIYADEVDGSTVATNTISVAAGSATLKNWNLPPNDYERIIVEADGDYWYFVDIATVVRTNWFIVHNSVKHKEVLNQLVGTAAGPADGNAWSGRESVFVKTIFAGGQTTQTNISFGVGVSAKRSTGGVRAQSFRVYGVK